MPSVLLLHFKSISHAPDRLDILGMCGIKLHFFTDLLDMHCNSSNITDRIHITDLSEQFLLGKNIVGILGQEGQQVKLFGGKGLLHTIHIHTAGGLVDL